ncbi:MAG: hypothetical protein ACRD44_12590 [Bryobacteraceae bacterium]
METQSCCQSHGGAALLERPRFFPRQLVTPDDLMLAQDYLRNKLRRMTRYLHGWGVVCGARVVFPDVPPEKLPDWKVVVKPGYILGPRGDEIVIDREICFDLRNRCFQAISGDPCAESVTEAGCGGSARPPASGDRYIAVRYLEFPSRPVRVQPAACGCDDTRCEYSRWRDGYEICVLDRCPPSHARPEPTDPQTLPDCPPCPDDPWVVLAMVNVDAQGKVTRIENCSCRILIAPPARAVCFEAPTPRPASS